jgi:hypothetical protein
MYHNSLKSRAASGIFPGAVEMEKIMSLPCLVVLNGAGEKSKADSRNFAGKNAAETTMEEEVRQGYSVQASSRSNADKE